ncbi:MAG: DUF4153 domain-containing protein, partial [Mucilaginibacter polytrichastri]|nr:DUF4153 domain-containing protein [Mucilaginibacter polytrichastri]
NVTNAARRFPVELLFALCGCLAATMLVEVQDVNHMLARWVVRALVTANIGLLASLIASLVSESLGLRLPQKSLFRVVAVLFSLGFFLLIDPAERETDYVRFVLLSLALHLGISFVAFLRRNINGFWQFNKTLFLRFLAGGLYSFVLFAGLSAAIGSMNLLFGFEFEWDTFVILWIWIVGLFQTLFFLAGVPADLSALESDESYPKGLKVFTQYVLIPLASVYVLILLSYELKIILQWKLPEGKVSNLILGYAVFGILSLLLIFPIRDRDENKWIKTYSRSFYLLMLPLIGLLVVAVLARVLSYGVTVPRYFLLVLAAWLTFITLYFLVSKKQNIRVIPFSLALVTLATVYGPQDAFSISERSQISVLKNLFRKYGSFDGRFLKPIDPTKVDSIDRERIRNVSSYVVSQFGLESLQKLVKPDLEKVKDSIRVNTKGLDLYRYSQRFREEEWLNKQYKIDQLYPPASDKAGVSIARVNGRDRAISLSGYRYMINLDNTQDS